MTDIPENPSEKAITINMIGITTSMFAMPTPRARAIPRIRLDWSADMSDIASIFPNAIDVREIGEVSALFINPYLLSHKVFTPPKMLVKIAVSIMTPGAMNSMYEPENPTDWMSGLVLANVLPITIIQIAGWISLISIPLRDFLYLFISLQKMVYVSESIMPLSSSSFRAFFSCHIFHCLLEDPCLYVTK